MDQNKPKKGKHFPSSSAPAPKRTRTEDWKTIGTITQLADVTGKSFRAIDQTLQRLLKKDLDPVYISEYLLQVIRNMDRELMGLRWQSTILRRAYCHQADQLTKVEAEPVQQECPDDIVQALFDLLPDSDMAEDDSNPSKNEKIEPPLAEDDSNPSKNEKIEPPLAEDIFGPPYLFKKC